MTKLRIKKFYEHFDGKVYISWSGGKDSSVLLDIAEKLYPSIPVVFSNTGLEYPEIVNHVKTKINGDYKEKKVKRYKFKFYKDGKYTIIRPKKGFEEVIQDEGYPVVGKNAAKLLKALKNPKPTNFNTRRLTLTGMKSNGEYSDSFKLSKKWWFLINAPFKISHRCCNYLKKSPFNVYKTYTGQKDIVGTLANESTSRRIKYLKYGCNSFEKGKSRPLSFWTEQDILKYIKRYNIKIASIYGNIIKDEEGNLKLSKLDRTGCMFCLFGIEQDSCSGKNRFQKMEDTHPKLHHYCINKLGIKEVLKYMGLPWKKSQNKEDINRPILNEEDKKEILRKQLGENYKEYINN